MLQHHFYMAPSQLYFKDFIKMLVALSDIREQTPEVFYKKALLKIFAIFTGKHLFWALFLIKL